MAKKKPNKSKAEKSEVSAQEAPTLAAVKTDLTVARDTFDAFIKKNKLEKGKDYTKDKKYGKEYTKLTTAINELTAKRTELECESKKEKSKKKALSSRAKYEYPADIVTPEQRKKYRVEQRKLANKKEKTEKDVKSKESKGKAKETKEEPSKGKAKKKNTQKED